ncbi:MULTISPECIES: hypothetical protein [Virgibacillus]|uniref:hypothetical protein n=1 Tax=Virgibacillus TaxID=84406 RepID=UPI000319893A|nr:MULTISPECIES: hypothetical protein [Virgibacillus]AIF44883.1 hypothetical protein X953_18530 [Virgibacillus sp. SK37]MCJ0932135.1 hypothetical protein [Virgibacillus halodenitrificans]
MAYTAILTNIGILILSILAGLFSFYLISDLPKEEKKKQAEEITSQIINFILFIWLGKIILHLGIFIQDPLAVLAYPSNSHALYLGLLFTSLAIAYKKYKQKIEVSSFILSFVPVFLVASFVYEFIEVVWRDNFYHWKYLTLLLILLGAYLILHNRLSKWKLIWVTLTGWIAGQLLLSYLMPYTTAFGYTMAPWFLILFYIASSSLIFFRKKVFK